jgi:hypothetical protein
MPTIGDAKTGLRGPQGDTSVWAQSRGCAQTDASKGYYSAARFPVHRSLRKRQSEPRSGAGGLGDTTVDPGDVLLRLLTQSAARAEPYAMLLEEAYEAAERLKRSFDAGALEIDESKVMADTAREDLDRIFNTGGVAALVGNTYGAAKDVGVYVTGEAIRGLADLEAKERERCANFATKAIAAGLAERTVRVAERQGQLMVEMVQAALREVDLSPEQASAFKAALARQARELTA